MVVTNRQLAGAAFVVVGGLMISALRSEVLDRGPYIAVAFCVCYLAGLIALFTKGEPK